MTLYIICLLCILLCKAGTNMVLADALVYLHAWKAPQSAGGGGPDLVPTVFFDAVPNPVTRQMLAPQSFQGCKKGMDRMTECGTFST